MPCQSAWKVQRNFHCNETSHYLIPFNFVPFAIAYNPEGGNEDSASVLWRLQDIRVSMVGSSVVFN